MELPFFAETKLETQIVQDSEWISGANWGEPREGHPEGKVIHHIQEVLANVEKLNATKEIREKLRIISLVHDTFKNKVDMTKPLSGENHHGMIARRFAEKYISDIELLEIIELHDEAFNSWQKGNRDKKWNKAEERAQKLLDRLKSSVQLYLLFYKCDNETGNKNQDCLIWFEKFAKEKTK